VVDEGDEISWEPAKTPESYRSYRRRQVGLPPKPPTPRRFLGYATFVGVPLAAIAWWRHGVLVGGAVLVVLTGIYLINLLRNHRFAADMFKPKSRRSRLLRLVGIVLATGLATWCIAAVVDPAPLADDAVKGVITGVWVGVFNLWQPRWLQRHRDRKKVERSVPYRQMQKELRAARRNGG
jgi:hypothetical protein